MRSKPRLTELHYYLEATTIYPADSLYTPLPPHTYSTSTATAVRAPHTGFSSAPPISQGPHDPELRLLRTSTPRILCITRMQPANYPQPTPAARHDIHTHIVARTSCNRRGGQSTTGRGGQSTTGRGGQSTTGRGGQSTTPRVATPVPGGCLTRVLGVFNQLIPSSAPLLRSLTEPSYPPATPDHHIASTRTFFAGRTSSPYPTAPASPAPSSNSSLGGVVPPIY